MDYFALMSIEPYPCWAYISRDKRTMYAVYVGLAHVTSVTRNYIPSMHGSMHINAKYSTHSRAWAINLERPGPDELVKQWNKGKHVCAIG